MKKTILISVLLWLSFPVVSQQAYFIFIQSDKGVPFYTRMGDTVLSSSAIGHQIISGLKDSTYNLFIGFPGEQSKETTFSVKITGKDRGFEFKNMPPDGWILYDWQSMEMIKSHTSVRSGSDGNSTNRRTDAFTQLMAGVVNDSSVMYKTIVRVEMETLPEAPKKETAEVNTAINAVTTSKDSTGVPDSNDISPVAGLSKENTGKPEVADSATSKMEAEYTKVLNDSAASPVNTVKNELGLKLESEVKSKDQLVRLYLDRNESGTDSIQVIITILHNERLVESDFVKPEKPDTSGNSVYVNNKEQSGDPVNKPETQGIKMINSDCRNYASVNDLDKLRVAIIKEGKLEDKLMEARKTFRSMCFTTRQIAALTELFITDEARFLLFETAYPFVSDSGNFKSLSEYLKDSFYLTRFRVLTKA